MPAARRLCGGVLDKTVNDNAADSAAYSGELAKSRELFRQAVASGLQAGEKEAAASCEAAAASNEAFVGNIAQAKLHAAASLALSNGRDAEYRAALALAKAEDAMRATSLAADLAARFPEDTTVQFVYLPTIHAQLALNHGDSAKAVELLQAALPYESGVPTIGQAWSQFNVRYYLFSLVFVVFDVEIIYLYPWAVVSRRLGAFAFYEILIFLIILALGLVYAWRKGALEWS